MRLALVLLLTVGCGAKSATAPSEPTPTPKPLPPCVFKPVFDNHAIIAEVNTCWVQPNENDVVIRFVNRLYPEESKNCCSEGEGPGKPACNDGQYEVGKLFKGRPSMLRISVPAKTVACVEAKKNANFACNCTP